MVDNVAPLSSMTKEPRIKKMTVNEDGSVTYLIRKELHSEVYDYFVEEAIAISRELVENSNKGIQKVYWENGFMNIRLWADDDISEQIVDDVILVLGNSALTFQVYLGLEPYVVVEVLSESKDDIIKSKIFEKIKNE